MFINVDVLMQMEISVWRCRLRYEKRKIIIINWMYVLDGHTFAVEDYFLFK